MIELYRGSNGQLTIPDLPWSSSKEGFINKQSPYWKGEGEYMLDGNQIHKLWLDDFWSYFGGKKNLGYGYKQSLKLKHVKRLAQVEVEFKNQRRRTERRKEFDKVKKYRHSLETHEPCFICLREASVRHHLIQLKNGGINCKKNIVSLCNDCHEKIHPWLKHKGVYKIEILA